MSLKVRPPKSHPSTKLPHPTQKRENVTLTLAELNVMITLCSDDFRVHVWNPPNDPANSRLARAARTVSPTVRSSESAVESLPSITTIFRLYISTTRDVLGSTTGTELMPCWDKRLSTSISLVCCETVTTLLYTPTPNSKID